MKTYEITYDVVVRCVTKVTALSEASAITMVRTGEAGDVEADWTKSERTIVSCDEPEPAR